MRVRKFMIPMVSMVRGVGGVRPRCGNQLAVPQFEHLIHLFGQLKGVCDDNQSCVFPSVEIQEESSQILRGSMIEGTGWFVRQDQGR